MIEDKQELIEKTKNYVRVKLFDEPTGRDWYHVERVRKTAKALQSEEGGELFIIELASLLHDVGDYKKYGFSQRKGDLALDAMMDILEIDNQLQERIMSVVQEAQYNGIETKSPQSIEGRIIQDSDFLECMGAIGVARTFAIGGSFGRPIYNPKRGPREVQSRVDYQKKKFEGTSFNYFYEKSLKLPELMNTKTGKKIALRRVKYLETFIEEFLHEWNSEDIIAVQQDQD